MTSRHLEISATVPIEARETEGEAPVEPPASLTAEEAIAALKGKIDRIGPVNMMAIEQHEELETRHLFLTTQRKDLVDSIALLRIRVYQRYRHFRRFC